MLRAIFAGVFALVGTAAEAWQLHSAKDPITDKPVRIASVEAKGADGGMTAAVQLECPDDRLVGGHVVSFLFSPRMRGGSLGIRYRIDDREVEMRFLVSKGDVVSVPNIDLDQLRRAKRLRLEIFPVRSEPLFFEFDVSGAERAFAHVPCVDRK